MKDLLRDIRYGLRALVREPGFTAVVVLTVTLGIGVATAVFSVVDQALFRLPPGIEHAERLLTLYRGGDESPSGAISYPDYLDIKEQSRSFADIAVTFDSTVNIGTEGGTERVSARLVSSNYFAVLGARAALSRPFNTDDEGRIVVIGHELWRRWFGSRSDIIGRVVSLNRHAYTVVGVSSSAFRGTTTAVKSPEFWVPITQISDFVPAMGSRPLGERHWSMFRLIGRLSEGSEQASAAGELDSLAASLESQDPSSQQPRRFQAESVAGSTRPSQAGSIASYWLVLSGAVLLVLMIACANVVNLVLGPGANSASRVGCSPGFGRRHELPLKRKDLTLYLGTGCILFSGDSNHEIDHSRSTRKQDRDRDRSPSLLRTQRTHPRTASQCIGLPALSRECRRSSAVYRPCKGIGILSQ